MRVRIQVSFLPQFSDNVIAGVDEILMISENMISYPDSHADGRRGELLPLRILSLNEGVEDVQDAGNRGPGKHRHRWKELSEKSIFGQHEMFSC